MKNIMILALGLTLAGAAAASAQEGWNRGGDHHDWDRQTFDREYGARGADWGHQWRRGDRLPDGYANDRRYVVSDYRQHHLRRPAYGYRWVRYGDGYVQVRNNGYVVRSIYGSPY